MKTVTLLGHLPIAAVDRARKVLVIGYGMGMTTSTIALHDEVESLDVVELSEGVVEASRFFSSTNRNVLEDPRVRLRVDDGRNWLLMTKEKYDVISCDPIHPAIGSGALYTRDFFQLAKNHLNEGGAFVQYLPFHRMSSFDFKTLVRTFQSVFPSATVWDGAGHAVLLGTAGSMAFDIDRLERMVESDPELREELSRWGVADPADLLSCLMLDAQSASELAGDGPINSDDHPLIEFSEPRSHGRNTRTENLSAVTQYEPLAGDLIRGTDEARARLAPRLALSTSVRRMLARANLEVSRGDVETATRLIVEAWSLLPSDPDVRALAGSVAVKFWLDGARELAQAGRYEEATDLCLRALAVDPGDSRVLKCFGLLCEMQGRLEEAIDLFERAAASDPADPQAVAALGQVYGKAGLADDAARAYARLGSMEGVDPAEAYRGLATLVSLGRYREATGLAEIYARARPNDADALATLGQCYAASSRLREAIEAWEKALDLRPGDTRLRQVLSEAYRISGVSPKSETR